MENVKVDIFFVKTDSIKNLYAYEVELTPISEEKKGEEMNKILNDLPYYLRRQGGHWARDRNFIISDVEVDEEELKNILQELRGNKKFQFLKGIRRVQGWEPEASSYAAFVAGGLSKDEKVEKEIKQKLEELEGYDFRKPYKKEKIEVRRKWKLIDDIVINGKPAIGVLINSEIVSRITLKDFLREEGISVEDFINKEPYKEWKVKDKEANLVGRVISVIGTMKEKRNELVNKTTKPSRKKRYERIPDDEEVVVVETEDEEPYVYPISELLISINSGNIKYFVDEETKKNVFNDLKIKPNERMKMVNAVVQPLKNRGWIEGERISDKEYPNIFVKPEPKKRYFPPVRIGGGEIVERERNIYDQIRSNGIYEMVKKDLKIAFSVFGETKDYDYLNKFIKTLEKEIKALGFNIYPVYVNFQKPKDIKEEIEKIKETGANILVAFIEDGEYGLDDNYESNIYNKIKMYSLQDPILQTQVITFKTLRKILKEKDEYAEYILGNIVLGILAKTENKPFIFAEPILGVDALVGLDVTRRKKKKGQGTINYAAGVRIYHSNGEFFKYKLTTSPLEGETIPREILENLLGDIKKDIKDIKKVVIHRDGKFPQDEIKVLKDLEKNLGTKFYLVEVIKSGAPRIYSEKKGTWVKINENKAYLLTTSRTLGTPVPIIVRLPEIYEDFSIEDAVISITSMTLLHWGSIKPPRLPVTTHYADKIGQFLLEGIISDLEEYIPFWL
ncbi:MAG: Piwi domain-containing protein [Candidatus Caldipriscus sp.]